MTENPSNKLPIIIPTSEYYTTEDVLTSLGIGEALVTLNEKVSLLLLLQP
jgi:hypothetical protein